MNALFVYDNGAPIPFYIEANQANVGAQIQQYGGFLASALQARFHIVSFGGAILPPMNPNVPVLRAHWVLESIQEGRMLPIYSYLDQPEQANLHHLSTGDRDVAELLKAKVGNHGDEIFDQLHLRLPHNTTDGWRALYQNSQVEIPMAQARIVSANEEVLNRLILPFFPQQAIPVGQRLRVDDDGGRGPRAPSEDQDAMGEEGYSVGANDLETDEHTDSESISQPPSTVIGQQLLVVDFIGDSDEDSGEQGYTEDDDDTEYADSGRPPSPSETPPPRRDHRARDIPSTRGGVRFTIADYDAMVRFVSRLDHEPVTADWEIFWNLQNVNQVRSVDAWRRKYSKDREKILADAFRMRSRGA